MNITNLVHHYLYRGKFDALIKKLRDEDCLDECNLKKVVVERRKSNTFCNIWFYGIVFPALVLLSYLFYLCLFDSAIILRNVVEVCVQFASAALICAIYLVMVREDVAREWRYIQLMTFGEKTNGFIVSFYEQYFYPKILCEYYYRNLLAHKIYSKMNIPLGSDFTFNYKKGDKVRVAYDLNRPENSVVISSKMRMCNLKKGAGD